MMFVRAVEPRRTAARRLRLRLASHRELRRTLRARASPAAITSVSPPRALHYRVTTDASLAALLENRPRGAGAAAALHHRPGRDAAGVARGAGARVPRRPRFTYWQEWVRTLAVPADWQDAVIRAAITLKLCTYEDTGAVLAALTTSIPEAANSARNWDYRYCWLRDSYFVIQTLNRLGATRTMEAYLHFIDHIIAASNGRQRCSRCTASPAIRAPRRGSSPALTGYRGMGPVRFGNLAAEQVQHDVYGSVILGGHAVVLRRAAGALRRPDPARAAVPARQTRGGDLRGTGRRVRGNFAASCSATRSPRRISWAGCDRLGRIARRVGDDIAARDWSARASYMRQEILTGAWSEERQAFTSAFGNRDLDATALLLPELGLLPATDPRFLKTLERIERGAARRRPAVPLQTRRRLSDAPENAFTICAFWYVNALAAAGRVDEARERFTRLLARRNPLGLLSEDIQPASGELWGNFPQTYSMVGVIGSALRLSRSWEEIV